MTKEEDVKDYMSTAASEEMKKARDSSEDIERAKSILSDIWAKAGLEGSEEATIIAFKAAELGTLCVMGCNGKVYYGFGERGRGEYNLSDFIDAESAKKVLEISQSCYQKKLRPEIVRSLSIGS